MQAVISRDRMFDVYFALHFGAKKKLTPNDYEVLRNIYIMCDKDGLIMPNKIIKERIAKNIGTSFQVVANSINNLSKQEFLLKHSRSAYFVRKYFDISCEESAEFSIELKTRKMRS